MAARRTDVHQFQEVVRLHRLNVSQRRIARDLRMGRTMVGRAQEAFKGAGLLEGDPSALPELADLNGLSRVHHHRSSQARQEAVHPWLAHHGLRVLAYLASGMTQEEILADFPDLEPAIDQRRDEREGRIPARWSAVNYGSS